MRLTMRIDALMNVCHKVVEMRTALAFHRQERKEHVHQHGLAAPDLAMNIKPLDDRRRILALAEQPAKSARFA